MRLERIGQGLQVAQANAELKEVGARSTKGAVAKLAW
jgi:hypothetical protein